MLQLLTEHSKCQLGVHEVTIKFTNLSLKQSLLWTIPRKKHGIYLKLAAKRLLIVPEITFYQRIFLILQKCKILQFEFLVLRQVKLVLFESMINHRCSFLHRPTIRSKDDNFSRRQEPVPIDIILFYSPGQAIYNFRTVNHTWCRNFRIFLSFWFYVKSFLENIEVLKLLFLQSKSAKIHQN